MHVYVFSSALALSVRVCVCRFRRLCQGNRCKTENILEPVCSGPETPEASPNSRRENGLWAGERHPFWCHVLSKRDRFLWTVSGGRWNYGCCHFGPHDAIHPAALRKFQSALMHIQLIFIWKWKNFENFKDEYIIYNLALRVLWNGQIITTRGLPNTAEPGCHYPNDGTLRHALRPSRRLCLPSF